jgi:predicted site-specific integrase-resolvase
MHKTAADLLNDPWLKLQTLAKWADVSVNTLKNEARRGRLKIVKMSPRALRVRASEARRYAESREVRA